MLKDCEKHTSSAVQKGDLALASCSFGDQSSPFRFPVIQNIFVSHRLAVGKRGESGRGIEVLFFFPQTGHCVRSVNLELPGGSKKWAVGKQEPKE